MMTTSDVIDTRSGNALFPDPVISQQALITAANLVDGAAAVAEFGRSPWWRRLSWMVPKIVNREAEWIGKRQGGLWVHGRVVLYKSQLSFTPSSIDTYFHEGPESLNWATPLSEISDVTLRRGLIADIVDVQSLSGPFTIRCFRAKAFIAEIEKARCS